MHCFINLFEKIRAISLKNEQKQTESGTNMSQTKVVEKRQ